ncbi:hypothetical protein BD410DRAFT_390687 [Rickenella mellea]|uniref:Uncharacterized protein n=1 Tax=Rickenella mellea TaxID=50990 RepID=A0A4Y7PY43_9AGAM|nr:hypothetical protein BD410DRAFT_390687 [Rickenella mellea]
MKTGSLSNPSIIKLSLSSRSRSSTLNEPPALPTLPVEILLDIFEYAALSSTGCARSLSVVASWTTQVGRRALYNTVCLKSSSHVLSYNHFKSIPFGDAYLTRKSRIFLEYAPYVQNVWLDKASSTDLYLFDHCKNIVNLAMHPQSLRAFLSSKYHGKSVNSTMVRCAPCRELTLTSDMFRYDWEQIHPKSVVGKSFLANLTHLCLLSMKTSHYIPFSDLARLTHFAIPYDTNIRVFQDAISREPPLEMIVATSVSGGRNFEDFLPLDTDRGLMYILAYYDPWKLWCSGARLQQGIWERATKLKTLLENPSIAEKPHAISGHVFHHYGYT